ncbi:hypothetical protein [Nocardiopsis sp. NRRL B-16309]|uniref:hypothetical protein n=1 Tax=Nocardiopsis sp. NRRL B-16309 TaxID=1519494 RepID=UPI0006B01903|nr:hypothetical protein [Nocardiopsis sp. NRRL B-16309]KOX10160.1 hypothetical protein ADL05_26150 [Nocardiopsis sp. NRRL B-16309]
MKFRTGASGRTLRVQIGDHPDDMDLLIGIVDTTDQADIIVNAVNAVARIRELHRPVRRGENDGPWCNACNNAADLIFNGPRLSTVRHPCPTIRAIDGSDDE